MVGGIVVDDAVVQFSQSGAGKQFLHRLPGIHLREADNVGEGAKFIPRQHYRLGYAVALVPEMRLIREEVLHIPEHH